MEIIWVSSLASFIIPEDDNFRLPINGRWLGMWFRELTGKTINMEKVSAMRFTFKDDHLILNINTPTWEGDIATLQYSTYPDKMQKFLIRITKFIFEED